jgi:hypothetical protein
VLPERFGTLTEIDALARWLRENPDIRSVLVVSSDSHLRRIRMCCRSLLNGNVQLAFLAAPHSPSELPAPATSEQQEDHPQPEESSGFASAKVQACDLLGFAEDSLKPGFPRKCSEAVLSVKRSRIWPSQERIRK